MELSSESETTELQSEDITTEHLDQINEGLSEAFRALSSIDGNLQILHDEIKKVEEQWKLKQDSGSLTLNNAEILDELIKEVCDKIGEIEEKIKKQLNESSEEIKKLKEKNKELIQRNSELAKEIERLQLKAEACKSKLQALLGNISNRSDIPADMITDALNNRSVFLKEAVLCRELAKKREQITELGKAFNALSRHLIVDKEIATIRKDVAFGSYDFLDDEDVAIAIGPLKFKFFENKYESSKRELLNVEEERKELIAENLKLVEKLWVHYKWRVSGSIIPRKTVYNPIIKFAKPGPSREVQPVHLPEPMDTSAEPGSSREVVGN